MNKEIKQHQHIAPIIKKHGHFHIIWPILIIVFILSLMFYWNSYSKDDIKVTIIFNHAQGIEAGKTGVVYNGINVGAVMHVDTTSDLKKVSVDISVSKKFKDWLTDKTEFWLVKPRIGLSGITGLETLVSGNYIAIKPNNLGKPKRKFIALTRAPIEHSINGLHLILISESLHSIEINSPVYFHQIEIGKVIDYDLEPTDGNIKTKIVIFDAYANLIRKNSRFWNASGIKINAKLSGLSVEMESLISVLRGGIDVYTPEWEAAGSFAQNEDNFFLYSNFDEAQAGIPIKIHFNSNSNVVAPGANIMFKNVKIGTVKTVKMFKNLSSFNVEANITPEAEHFMVKGAAFWIQSPQIKLQNFSKISSFINGNHIEMDVSPTSLQNGIKQTEFTGYEKRPSNTINLPGLNLTLVAKKLDSLSFNTPLLYKGFQIGQINFTQLSPDGEQIMLYVNIEPAYINLINSSTRFIPKANYEISGSLSDLKITASPLENFIFGSIEVVTKDLHQKPLKSNQVIPLTYQFTQQSTKLLLTSLCLDGINKGVPVLYRGIAVGQVVDYYLDNPANQVIIEITINHPYEKLISKNSQFWNDSGINLKASLFSGVKLETNTLSNIMKGAISFATPFDSQHVLKPLTRFVLHDKPKQEWLKWQSNIKIKKRLNRQ